MGGRLPYLDRCDIPEGGTCDEYPVLTMYWMRAVAWLVEGYGAFFHVNAGLLAAVALGTAALLHRLVGTRSIYFALAPSLLVYGFVNWDLLPVGLATAGTYAFLKDRDRGSGVLLGLGAAAKLYPALLVVPFVLDRIRTGRRKDAWRLTAWGALSYGAVNAPFALAAADEWATFFRFNAFRVPDWGSLWFIACDRLGGDPGPACSWSTNLVNWLSLGAFLLLAALLGWAMQQRGPDIPAWTFAFPLIVAFLLTNKVYSPQYSLWLLPWFALVLPLPRLFVAFQATDVTVFATTFWFFGRFEAEAGNPAFAGFAGAPLWAFQAAVGLRALVLLACLVAWVGHSRAGQEPAGVVPFPHLEART